MGQTLTDVAQILKDSAEDPKKPKKVQLVYAFNGTGKTRLSRAFKELVAPKSYDIEESEKEAGVKILYYNAFTEDLFYWDNDLNGDTDRKLKIQPNSFTNWVLKDQGQAPSIISNFQHYTNDKLTPYFNEEYTAKDENDREVLVEAYSEVTFSIERGDDNNVPNIKVSKGEESNFIWSVFYTLLEQVIEVLNEPEPDERDTKQFDDLEYIFIDDPVSSLDDNHLIELAVNVATLIKSSQSDLKFIITTHNPLFYNILFSEFNNKDVSFGYQAKHCRKFRLEKLDDGTVLLDDLFSDAPFSYHLHLFSLIDEAGRTGNIQKFHFNYLRNILEKTSTFLGYKHWGDLLKETELGESTPYVKRILNFASHSKYSGEEPRDIVTSSDKRVFKRIVKEIKDTYHFKLKAEEAK